MKSLTEQHNEEVSALQMQIDALQSQSDAQQVVIDDHETRLVNLESTPPGQNPGLSLAGLPSIFFSDFSEDWLPDNSYNGVTFYGPVPNGWIVTGKPGF